MSLKKNLRFIDAQLSQMDKIGAKTDRVLTACAKLLQTSPEQKKARIAAQKRADRKFDRQMKLLARQLSNRRQR